QSAYHEEGHNHGKPGREVEIRHKDGANVGADGGKRAVTQGNLTHHAAQHAPGQGAAGDVNGHHQNGLDIRLIEELGQQRRHDQHAKADEKAGLFLYKCTNIHGSRPPLGLNSLLHHQDQDEADVDQRLFVGRAHNQRAHGFQAAQHQAAEAAADDVAQGADGDDDEVAGAIGGAHVGEYIVISHQAGNRDAGDGSAQAVGAGIDNLCLDAADTGVGSILGGGANLLADGGFLEEQEEQDGQHNEDEEADDLVDAEESAGQLDGLVGEVVIHRAVV